MAERQQSQENPVLGSVLIPNSVALLYVKNPIIFSPQIKQHSISSYIVEALIL